ncbi:c-type cytochrome [Bradyrhizobium tropiciagri]|uniref:c-type cytochrome n=1 Tax=Bradyrhizobium tropiciagri TaxID=312253 RepID=UPI001009EF6A|nr:cytochrome c [Bradyrhizobium tropiciagri]
MRVFIGAVIVGAIVALGAVWYVRGPDPLAFTGGKSVALADYKDGDPTGVPTSMRQASLLERGRYLTEAADCGVCHTAPGGKEYAGGFAFKMPFGTMYSTNITPDKETGIGKYTDQEFLDAMHRGIRRDGARLYPAMPYTSYAYITDADALAIKAYLFSLASVRAVPPENTLMFPFNQRWAMAFWSLVFNRDTRFRPDPSQSLKWNRGAYLAEALAHCGECHTPRNIGFALNNREKFAGAPVGGWRAFNISPDKATGLGGWSDEDIASYLSLGHAPGHGTASGAMGEAVDHSFSKMTQADIEAMVAFVRSVPPSTTPDFALRSAPAPASHKDGVAANLLGKKIFEGACASCHGWTGESAVSPFATLTGSAAINDPSATNVAQIVIGGTRRLTPARALSMPSFGHVLSDDEIAAVSNYVTARFGAKGSSLTARDVANMRAQVSD